MRSTSRVVGCSLNSVIRLFVRAGQMAWVHHDQTVRGVRSSRVECDEIWAFAYAKRLNVPNLKNPPSWAGDVWTWMAVASDSRLLVSYVVGGRSEYEADVLMGDLADRLDGPTLLSTDGLVVYEDAVRGAFGPGVDYGQIVKVFGGAKVDESKRKNSPKPITGLTKRTISGEPDEDLVSTSYVERQNLTMRMSIKRFARLGNAFSKKVENHLHAVSLYTAWYNFCRPHSSLGLLTTPAMAAGLAERPLDLEFLVELVEARELELVRNRGPYKRRT